MSEHRFPWAAFWFFVAVVASLAFAGRSAGRAPHQKARYHHDLSYPADQQKDLIQVGSLDRG